MNGSARKSDPQQALTPAAFAQTSFVSDRIRPHAAFASSAGPSPVMLAGFFISI